MTADEGRDRMIELFEELKQMLERRFDGLSQEVQGVDQKVDTLEQKVDTLEQKVDTLEQKVEDQKASLNNLSQYILDFRKEIAARLEVMGDRLDLFHSSAANFDSRASTVNKALLDFGATHTQLAREQWQLKDANFDLAARVAKLEEIVAKLVKPAA